MFAAVLGALIVAFFTGVLARFALPGPDPMPPWLTIAIGLIGGAVGYGVYVASGRQSSWSGIASFGTAVLLVGIYRRFIQKRPLWGKDAYRFPERGFGIEQYRERLKRSGIDPDQIGVAQPTGVAQPGFGVQRPPASAYDHPGEPTENPAHYLGLLEELHDSGVLDDSEYNDARMRLLEKLR